MNQAPSAIQADEPRAVSTWPFSVQIALGLMVTASLFFLLGRWSQNGAPPLAEYRAATERPVAGLDLNRATKAELRLIPGLGDALAQRVIDYRARTGSFRTVDELRQVAGIGPKTLDRLRHCLFVTPEESFVSDDESEPMSTSTKPKSPPRAASISKKAASLTGPINVNRASQTELQRLPGVGPKISQRILDQRAKGAYRSVDDLRRVAGIGPKTLEKLRPHVTVDE